MAETIPAAVTYCVVGAGVHGLSTAWHLARELKSRNRGTGADVVVLDKTGVAAGASGIACGVVRNHCVQPIFPRDEQTLRPRHRQPPQIAQ